MLFFCSIAVSIEKINKDLRDFCHYASSIEIVQCHHISKFPLLFLVRLLRYLFVGRDFFHLAGSTGESPAAF